MKKSNRAPGPPNLNLQGQMNNYPIYIHYGAEQPNMQPHHPQNFTHPYVQQPRFSNLVTVAVPPANRIAGLERNLDYVFKDKSLVSRACARILAPYAPFEHSDEELYLIEDNHPAIVIRQRMLRIGHQLFGAEIERLNVENSGVGSLLYAFPQHILDDQILEINKAILGAILLDGGFEAVAKVMPGFYGLDTEEQVSVARASAGASNDDNQDQKPVIKREEDSEAN